jgi:hypothetical protein
MAEIRFSLGEPEDYHPITLSRVPEDQLRDEYRRLRRVAQDRFRRIDRSKDFSGTDAWKHVRADLRAAPSEIPDKDLPQALSSLASFLSAKTGSLTGLRRQRNLALESLRAHGIRGINKSNWNEFKRFMDATQVFREVYIPYPKKSEGSRELDAARLIRPRLFNLAEQGNISLDAMIKNFEWFKDHEEEVRKASQKGKINGDRARAYSGNEVRQILGFEPVEQPRSTKAATEEARQLRAERRKNRR